MTAALRRFKISTRIIALAAVAVILLMVVMVTALGRFGRQETASTATLDAIRLAHVAMEAKFRTADAAGWQTGYAFDFNRGVPRAAEDSVGQRKEFVASSAALTELYAQLGEHSLPPEQAELLTTARTAFQEFLEIDQQIVKGYRQGTKESILASNELASGASLDAFGTAATATSELAALITEDGTTAAGDAAASSAAGSRTLWLIGGTGLMLLIILATLVVVSIARPLRAIWHGLQEVVAHEGDLRTRLPEGGQDELSLVASTFNRFAQGTAGIVGSVTQRTSALAATSGRLSELAHSLAGSAEAASDRAAHATGAPPCRTGRAACGSARRAAPARASRACRAEPAPSRRRPSPSPRCR